jgi:hypothetical protein
MAVHSVLESVTRDDLLLDPYPHIVRESCLPADYYSKLLSAFPSDETITSIYKRHPDCPPQIRESVIRQNTRYDISAFQLLEAPGLVPGIWMDFVRYHTSPQFFSEVLNLIGPEIRHTYPFLEERLGKDLSSFSTGVRFASACDVSLDCQLGINTPPTRHSTVRGPHTDAPVELFAILLYMKDEHDERAGGDLGIYRWKDPSARGFVAAEVEQDDAELVKTVRYKPNTMVLFLNSDLALHGVTPRDASTHTRRLLNIIGEVDQSLPSGLFVLPQKHAQQKKPWLRRKLRKLGKMLDRHA